MTKVFINIDVDDINRAVAFYREAFGLEVARRLGPEVVELAGAQAPIFLLLKSASTPISRAVDVKRDYRRHWTPVHLDFAVPDVAAAFDRAVAAGATAESEVETHAWGSIAYLADPFGHGLCLIQLSDQGYAALASPP
jgi:uncharacterized glyoxalase superfamily protein PhnB